MTDIKKASFKNSDGGQGIVTVYEENKFNEVVKGKQYDFVSIDGPYGFNNTFPLSRIDFLPYVPQCLNESFCIVIDDFNRIGEQNTAALIRKTLIENKIAFRDTVYSGSKDLYLLASADLAWLCSM